MGQLHHESGPQQVLLGCPAAELRRQVDQLGPETFAPSSYEMTGSLGDERGISHGDPPQLLLETDREGFDVERQGDSRDQRMNCAAPAARSRMLPGTNPRTTVATAATATTAQVQPEASATVPRSPRSAPLNHMATTTLR